MENEFKNIVEEIIYRELGNCFSYEYLDLLICKILKIFTEQECLSKAFV